MSLVLPIVFCKLNILLFRYNLNKHMSNLLKEFTFSKIIIFFPPSFFSSLPCFLLSFLNEFGPAQLVWLGTKWFIPLIKMFENRQNEPSDIVSRLPAIFGGQEVKEGFWGWQYSAHWYGGLQQGSVYFTNICQAIPMVACILFCIYVIFKQKLPKN